MFGSDAITRLVQAKVGGNDRRRLDRDVFEAGIDLAGDGDLTVLQVDLRGERALGPAEQGGQHLAGLVAVVVDRLFAENDQTGLFLLHHRLQKLGDGERLQLVIGLHVDRAIGPHGKRGPKSLLTFRRPERDGDHLLGLARFLQADRLLVGDLIEGIHRHFYVRGVDTGAVGLDPDLDVVVHDPLDRHEHFHD